jgi:hypothetical protein
MQYLRPPPDLSPNDYILVKSIGPAFVDGVAVPTLLLWYLAAAPYTTLTRLLHAFHTEGVCWRCDSANLVAVVS